MSLARTTLLLYTGIVLFCNLPAKPVENYYNQDPKYDDPLDYHIGSGIYHGFVLASTIVDIDGYMPRPLTYQIVQTYTGQYFHQR